MERDCPWYGAEPHRDRFLRAIRQPENWTPASESSAATTGPTTAPSAARAATKISFVSLRDDIKTVYVMNLDGSAQTKLLDNGDTYSAVWSPDGTKVALSSRRDSLDDIYVMNADGSGEVRRTADGLSQFPVWSPDGDLSPLGRLAGYYEKCLTKDELERLDWN